MKNFSAVYPGFKEKTYQLTYWHKFPHMTTRAIFSNEYDIRGHNIVHETILNS